MRAITIVGQVESEMQWGREKYAATIRLEEDAAGNLKITDINPLPDDEKRLSDAYWNS